MSLRPINPPQPNLRKQFSTESMKIWKSGVLNEYKSPVEQLGWLNRLRRGDEGDRIVLGLDSRIEPPVGPDYSEVEFQDCVNSLNLPPPVVSLPSVAEMLALVPSQYDVFPETSRGEWREPP